MNSGYRIIILLTSSPDCISERTRPRCEVQLSLPIIGVVILANAIKLFTIAFILWLHNHETIVTIGDAVQSFLQDPDQTTKDRCLLSTSNIGSQWQTDNSPDVQRWKQRYKPSWHTACSPRRWVVTIILYVFANGHFDSHLKKSVHSLRLSSQLPSSA